MANGSEHSSEGGPPVYESLLCNLLAIKPWANFSVSLHLSFHT